MRIFFINLLIVFSLSATAQDDGNDIIRNTGDVLQYAFPIVSIGSTFLYNDPSKPKMQLLKTGLVAAGLTQSLKLIINKKRPNGGDHAFPSGHTSSAFMGAAFLERRFGWKVGVPAYILAGFTGWSRVHANKHDYWDVLAGAIIGTGSAYLFTKPYMKNVDLNMSLEGNALSLGLKIQLN